MTEGEATQPGWDSLFDIAAAQDGYFTTMQAAEAGYSPQLLAHHVGAGRIRRTRRGIYRLVHFPPGEHEELTILWLWSEQAGIFSHQTALSLHALSDVLPAQVHLTVPSDWSRRRLRVPNGVVLHHADVPTADRTWFGSVPITGPARTLNDCASGGMSPELVRQAALEALDRGLVTKKQLAAVSTALQPFGGLR